ncbi:hypothetical protein TH53_04410 [Pedobacter lusitanus]|uniref:Lantibiotic dehydratase N-terminal domain-containing protein n=1 Tax=Pedobacter lusitanus TaxID=1503925 RepID=A0A0D0GQ24_9SPHI|nr:lantibiotic dehydratase [Pedobacter lusitanus]KIO78265.1 hypothetical protein TH53_04410 [Pedobacter lusitanus]
MISKSNFSFANNVVLRTPALPFISGTTEQEAAGLINNRSFMEALYLASPVLHQQAELLPGLALSDPKRIKIIQSLTKYYLRMSTRSTPFGLFSGCATVSWTDKAETIVLGESERKTRLDMQYLCDLIAELGKKDTIRTNLKYFPNSSHYYVGKQIRYAEYEYIFGLRQHKLSSADSSVYLEAVMLHAKNGCSFPDLVTLLEKEGVKKKNGQSLHQ